LSISDAYPEDHPSLIPRILASLLRFSRKSVARFYTV